MNCLFQKSRINLIPSIKSEVRVSERKKLCVLWKKKTTSSRLPWPSSQHRRNLLAPDGRGQRIRNKDSKQRMRENEKGTNERERKGVICPEVGQSTVSERTTVVTHRKIAVYKGTRGNPVLG